MIKSNYILLTLCVLFLIFKIASVYLTGFDLFGDEAQYWLWSKELDFGYYSKPPLLAWFINLFCWFFGSSFFTLKMMPIFLYCITSIVIFYITKKLYNNKQLAFITAITFFLSPAVSFSSFLLSTDILLILFWSLSMLVLLMVKDAPNKISFIILGIFVGLAFLSKYAAIYFFLSVVFLFFEEKMRSLFLKNKVGCLYCIITILIIIFPNIIWNFNNDWVTFEHTSDNAALDRFKINFFGAIEFIFSQIAMLGPLIFVVYVFCFSKSFKFDFNTKFLLAFSLPIFFVVLLEGFFVRANANWAAVSLVAFLILFVHTVYHFSKRLLLYNNLFNLFLGVVFFMLISTTSSYKPFNRINGISLFSDDLLNHVKDYNTLVVGDRLLFSSLSYVLKNDKVILYFPHSPKSKIKNHFQISSPLSSEFNKSFVFIGHEEQLNYLSNKYEINLLVKKNVVFQKEVLKIYEIIF